MRDPLSLLGRLFKGKDVVGDTLTIEHEMDASMDGTSVQMLLGGSEKPARTRAQLMQKYMQMSRNGIVSTALRAHVTAALGGHETSGELVFIEMAAGHEKDAAAKRIVDDIKASLGPIFNKIAPTSAFSGAAFGDAYGRIYSAKGRGVLSVRIDEVVHPALITPYEKGESTVGYVVAGGPKMTSRLNISQMARLKMPRMSYPTQVRAIEKATKLSIEEDDPDKGPILPAMVGGSFMDDAEEAYDSLITTLMGMSGQRLLNSIDETLLTADTTGMTKEQRKAYMENLKKILTSTKQRAEEAVRTGRPMLSRMYHILPTWGQKQLTAVSGSLTGSNNSNPMGIDDVMFAAKLLSGALGTDLSLLGFADLLAGGLGEGGFFRTSIQSAERSRLIRGGLTDFFNQIIDIHTYLKHGVIFTEATRPWAINFYGSISAVETERQHTRETAMNTGAALINVMAQARYLGLSEASLIELLSKNMGLDEAQSKMYARDIAKAQNQDTSSPESYSHGRF